MMWSKIKTGVIGVLVLALIATGLGRARDAALGQLKSPGASDSAKAPMSAKVGGTSRKAKELEGKLQASGNFVYKDIAFGDVLDDLRSQQGINIFVDPNAAKSREEGAVPLADIRVTVQLNDVPLETALRFLLKAANLAFVNQDGVLVVTTRDKTMIRKVYPVAKLMGEDEERNIVALVRAISTTVEPGNWSFVNPGTIQAMNQNVFNPFQGAAQPNGLGLLGGAGVNQFGNLGGVLGGGGIGGMFGMMGAGPPPAPPVEVGRAEGGGSIAYFPGTKTLVVRHYFEVHREIEELLNKLAEK